MKLEMKYHEFKPGKLYQLLNEPARSPVFYAVNVQPANRRARYYQYDAGQHFMFLTTKVFIEHLNLCHLFFLAPDGKCLYTAGDNCRFFKEIP